jgi:hypothetical protein
MCNRDMSVIAARHPLMPLSQAIGDMGTLRQIKSILREQCVCVTGWQFRINTGLFLLVMSHIYTHSTLLAQFSQYGPNDGGLLGSRHISSTYMPQAS